MIRRFAVAVLVAIPIAAASVLFLQASRTPEGTIQGTLYEAGYGSIACFLAERDAPVPGWAGTPGAVPLKERRRERPLDVLALIPNS
jgi:hypothetical protein